MNHETAKQKTFKAVVVTEDGKRFLVDAKKDKYGWLIGGDFPKSWGEGSKFFIQTKNGIYWLKGNRLIFQDHDDGKFFI